MINGIVVPTMPTPDAGQDLPGSPKGLVRIWAFPP